MDVFIILQLCRTVSLRHKWLSGESKENKTTLLKETQADQISYLNILNINILTLLGADAKSAILLAVHH